MSDTELSKFLVIAKEAASQAGEYLLKNRASAQKIKKEYERDIKIEADTQSEKLIIDSLRKKSNLSILSEERGMIERGDGDYIWVVDPVDGSLNYSRQIPLSCISIGLWRGKESKIGVVYDFNRSELFSGISSVGAWLNDVPINVSQTDTKQKSVLLTGFPSKRDFSTASIGHFIENIQSYRKVRLLGSAALSIAYVAAGRADAYYEENIMWWDVAGGIPLLLGAGGKLKIKKTSIPYCFDIAVTNGHISDELLQ